MSDPYSPYQTPSPNPQMDYYAPPPQAPGGGNSAARIAAMLLLGVVLLQVVQSGISIYYYATAPVSEYMMPEQQEQFREIGWPADAMRTVMMVAIGGCAGIIVLLLLVLVPFVNKGGRGATITALVIAGLLAIFALIGLVSAIVQMSGAFSAMDVPRPAPWFVASGLATSVLMLLTLVTLIVFLSKSLMQRSRLQQEQLQDSYAAQQALWQGHYAQQPPPPQQGPPYPPQGS
jgi:uncharacterized membrane protein